MSSLSIDELKSQNLILLECISGSKAYGLATEQSDTDIKGVFYLPKQQFFGLNQQYVAQVSNESNDIVYYELGRFIELLLKNNPTVMELLATPADKILYQHPLMTQLTTSMFISQLCQNTFTKYAQSQIKKSRSLNKKFLNPMAKEKKSILDFCMVLEKNQSTKLSY